MCQDHSKTKYCENPGQLKGEEKDCTKEQIEKCHGNIKGHPCVDKDTKDKG